MRCDAIRSGSRCDWTRPGADDPVGQSLFRFTGEPRLLETQGWFRAPVILNAASNDTWGEVKNAGKCHFYSYNVYQNVSLIAAYNITTMFCVAPRATAMGFLPGCPIVRTATAGQLATALQTADYTAAFAGGTFAAASSA